MASQLARLTLDQAIPALALARDIMLYSRQDTLLSQCLSPPRPGEYNELASHPVGEGGWWLEILSVT